MFFNIIALNNISHDDFLKCYEMPLHIERVECARFARHVSAQVLRRLLNESDPTVRPNIDGMT